MQALDHGTLTTAADFIALINAGALAKAICVAAELGIADHLAHGPAHAAALAEATHTHAPSLRRLLRALVAVDLCREGKDGSFALCEKGQLLRSEAPASLRNWALWYGIHMGPVWDELSYSVTTGQSARKRLTGVDGFAHLDADPEAAAVFNRAMAEYTALVTRELVRVCDFGGLRQFVDVGGGHGALLAALLQAQPEARGILFDLAHAMPGAAMLLNEAGVRERCDLVAGSFFDAVPGGADVYILKAIIHDWDDEQSANILRNCHSAMSRDAKLLIVERILPARFEACQSHHAIARADLTMLVALGGRERTQQEFVDLLGAAGFRIVDVKRTGLEYSVLEALPC